MTGWLSLGISIVALAVAVVFLRRMVERRTGAEVVLDEIRREVGAILTEMNQTTERNIELVEDRLGRLKTTLEQADRKLGLLSRETARRAEAEEYTRLSRSVPRVAAPPEAEVEVSRPPAAVDESAETEAGFDEPAEEPDVRSRILQMYRQGVDVDRIAKNVGTAVSEVELIVSLGGRQ